MKTKMVIKKASMGGTSSGYTPSTAQNSNKVSCDAYSQNGGQIMQKGSKLKKQKIGGMVKKMAVGGTTTKRIIKKSTGGMYGIPQENLGTSGQYGFAKKGGAVKKMKTSGTVKPLMKAQKGKIVKTVTPFQNYMKTPGAIASDTTQSFTGSRDGSKPVLDKAYYDTYYAGKENERRTGNDKVKYDANGKRVYKKGGATKAAKFAALAPPYNKATFADKIVGAKKSAGSKKLPKAQLGAIIKAFSKVVKPVAKAVKKAKPKTVDFRTAQTKDLVKNAFQNIERNSMKQKLQEIEKIRKLKYPNGDPVYKSIFNVKKP